MPEQAARIEGIPAGLQVRGLDRGQTPVADWVCSCGEHERASGRIGVQQMLTRVRVGVCAHRAAQWRGAA